MTTTTFDIRTDAAATFSTYTWALRDKVDDTARAESDLDEYCGEMLINNMLKALVQTNEAFQGTEAIGALKVNGNVDLDSTNPILTVGDGTGDPKIRLDKAAGSAAAMQWYDNGTHRWGLAMDASENLDLQRYNASAVFQDNPIEFGSDGDVTIANDLLMDNASPGVEMGNGSGSCYIRMDKGSASTGQLQFKDGGTDRWIQSFHSDEDLDFNRYNSSGVFQDTPFSLSNDGNIGLFTNDYGSGAGCIGIADAGTAPSGTPSGGGVLFVDGGALKYKGSGGTETTIANA